MSNSDPARILRIQTTDLALTQEKIREKCDSMISVIMPLTKLTKNGTAPRAKAAIKKLENARDDLLKDFTPQQTRINAIQRILNAKSISTILGIDPNDPSLDATKVNRAYKNLERLINPEKVSMFHNKDANSAYHLLNEARDAMLQLLNKRYEKENKRYEKERDIVTVIERILKKDQTNGVILGLNLNFTGLTEDMVNKAYNTMAELINPSKVPDYVKESATNAYIRLSEAREAVITQLKKRREHAEKKEIATEANSQKQALATTRAELIKRINEKQPFIKILDLPEDRRLTSKDIESAFRKSILLVHPDKAGIHGLTKEESDSMIQTLNKAKVAMLERIEPG